MFEDKTLEELAAAQNYKRSATPGNNNGWAKNTPWNL
jgi:hypothetical protein